MEQRIKPERVCPWWMGYLLASPVRRWRQDPHRILAPHVLEGMVVLEPGPGMGFFTLELARLVGPEGRVIVVDVQPRMLKVLARRAKRAQLEDRIELRQPLGNRMGVDDLNGQVDFVLAFAVVHELPDVQGFFSEMYHALRPAGRLLLSEPSGHVKEQSWERTLEAALLSGFQRDRQLEIRQSRTILLLKPSLPATG